MLADAEKGVKAKHMTDHPETEEANKKIIEEEKEAERKKHPEREAVHKKENLVEKVKGIVHHKS